MALSSGGTPNRWRRKRGKAARLRPVAEDSAATTRLFEAGGHPAAPDLGLPRRRPPAPTPVEAEADPAVPLVRYEWRSASGESLVVEAGWPGHEPPSDLALPVRRGRRPHVDLRAGASGS